MSKALLAGSDFKSLIANVTKMPSMGAFSGSEMINIQIKDGKCFASTFGVILSTSQVDAKGAFPLVGIDERLLIPFGGICADKSKVLIELTDGNEVQIRTAGDRQITAPFSKGAQYEIKPEGKSFIPDPEAAKQIGYLADIAFSDSSRPELNAVYLTGDGRAVAVNQKCVAVFKTEFTPQKTALPIPLARIIGENYKVFVGNETVIQNGTASYSMPSPIKAYQEFPIGFVNQCEKAKTFPLCSVNGEKLTQMIAECDSCLGAISRLEVVIQLNISPGKIELTSQNGGAKFRASIAASTLVEESQLQIPLEEVSHAAAFLSQEENISIAKGQGEETFFTLPDGWLMFPSFQSKGKKKKK